VEVLLGGGGDAGQVLAVLGIAWLMRTVARIQPSVCGPAVGTFGGVDGAKYRRPVDQLCSPVAGVLRLYVGGDGSGRRCAKPTTVIVSCPVPAKPPIM
jgi:hypothetical protein